METEEKFSEEDSKELKKSVKKKKFDEDIKELEEVLKALNQILVISSNNDKNIHFPYELSSIRVDDNIRKIDNKIKVIHHQYVCEHKNVTDFFYVGGDSKKRYYEKKCKDCDLMVEQYSE